MCVCVCVYVECLYIIQIRTHTHAHRRAEKLERTSHDLNLSIYALESQLRAVQRAGGALDAGGVLDERGTRGDDGGARDAEARVRVLEEQLRASKAAAERTGASLSVSMACEIEEMAAALAEARVAAQTAWSRVKLEQDLAASEKARRFCLSCVMHVLRSRS